MKHSKPKKLQKAVVAAVLIDFYCEIEPSGGCLHIIIEDGNYGKHFADHCLDYSVSQKDLLGEYISRMLMDFNEEEQKQIVERPSEIYNLIKSD